MGNSTEQARYHLDKRFNNMKPWHVFEKPAKGWIRAIRDALGMTSRQLAKRMGKAHTGVLSLESNELSGAITLQSLESAAKALNCRLIYALVPEDSLDAVVETRARELALKMFYEVSQSMKLENQEVTDSQDREKQIGKLTQEFITDIKRLWD